MKSHRKSTETHVRTVYSKALPQQNEHNLHSTCLVSPFTNEIKVEQSTASMHFILALEVWNLRVDELCRSYDEFCIGFVHSWLYCNKKMTHQQCLFQ